MGSGEVHLDFLQEADRIIHAAKAEGILLRLLGALAFSMHCPKFSHMQEMLGRTFSDIDFASYKKYARQISELFAGLGYQEDFMVTRLHGNQRLVFLDSSGTERHCDVFLDKLEFCHDISFRDRLEVDDPTVPLAELLLEKMQIVRLNDKDVIDTIMLFREHEVGNTDKETINGDYIAQLCAQDWGFWKTISTNLNRVEQLTLSMAKLSEEDKTDVRSKIKKLLTLIDKEPKTSSWKIRARIGERKKWYRDVEEFRR